MKANFTCICTFSNGDVIRNYFTNKNPEEIANYYTGHKFNLGVDADNMQICTKVEFIYEENKV